MILRLEKNEKEAAVRWRLERYENIVPRTSRGGSPVRGSPPASAIGWPGPATNPRSIDHKYPILGFLALIQRGRSRTPNLSGVPCPDIYCH